MTSSNPSTTTSSKTSAPRIAIPVPHSGDRAYAERSLPQYEAAVREAGGEPVRIELGLTPTQLQQQIERCDAVLLPGSRADVDPKKYGAARHEKTAGADAVRDMVDDALLDDAYKNRKPILGICYGLQSLNVYRSGTLLQHIESAIDHSPERAVTKAHTVQIEPKSQLAAIIGVSSDAKNSDAKNSAAGKTVAVNSSHHQSAEKTGDGLRVVAHSSDDGIIEALEGTDPDHFVLAVQWHPERSVNEPPELSESAKSIFSAFVKAAKTTQADQKSAETAGASNQFQ